jgi:hypothetical protein
MSFHADIARVHAARALDAVGRSDRKQPVLDGIDLDDVHFQLGYFKATVETLAHDIENLTKEASLCPL